MPTRGRLVFMAIVLGAGGALTAVVAKHGALPLPRRPAPEWGLGLTAGLLLVALGWALVRRSLEANLPVLVWTLPLAALAVWDWLWPHSLPGVSTVLVLDLSWGAALLLLSWLPNYQPPLPDEKVLVL